MRGKNSIEILLGNFADQQLTDQREQRRDRPHGNHGLHGEEGHEERLSVQFLPIKVDAGPVQRQGDS